MRHGSLFSGIGGFFIPDKNLCFRMKASIINCKVCGKGFTSYNPNPTYCSIECKGKAQSSEISFEKARELYEGGMSQAEVASALHTSQKVIHNVFKRNKYKCRVAAKRNQYGENNGTWKGDKATYAAFHYRVDVQRGKPQECSVCGRTDGGIYYEWANLTSNYQDVSDYSRMCRKCHRAYDKERINSSKHIPKKAKK
jgi:hypothetical protein